MALPKKGRRRIEVGGHLYHWFVGTCRIDFDNSPEGADATLDISLWIQRATGHGSKIHVRFRGEFLGCVPSLGFDDYQTIAIKPSDVRRIIEYALQRGWTPESTSSDHAIENGHELFGATIRPLWGDREFRAEEHLAPPYARMIWQRGD